MWIFFLPHNTVDVSRTGIGRGAESLNVDLVRVLDLRALPLDIGRRAATPAAEEQGPCSPSSGGDSSAVRVAAPFHSHHPEPARGLLIHHGYASPRRRPFLNLTSMPLAGSVVATRGRPDSLALREALHDRGPPLRRRPDLGRLHPGPGHPGLDFRRPAPPRPDLATRATHGRVHVAVVTDAGETLVDEGVMTYANGFVGFWLPRDLTGTVTVSAGTATSPFDFGADGPTCLTTLRLA